MAGACAGVYLDARTFGNRPFTVVILGQMALSYLLSLQSHALPA